MKTITQRLVEKGHSANSGICEKCWGEAYARSLGDTSKTQAEHYRDVLAEAERDADSPEVAR